MKSQPIHALVLDVVWCEFMTSNRFQPYADNKIAPVRMSAYHLLTIKIPSSKASLSSLFRSTGDSILSIYDRLLVNLNLSKLITFFSGTFFASCYFF